MSVYSKIAGACVLLALCACAKESPNYDASATCQDRGMKPGTAEYDQCVKDEKAAAMMEQQRKDYEDMKQQQQDWNMRRF